MSWGLVDEIFNELERFPGWRYASGTPRQGVEARRYPQMELHTNNEAAVLFVELPGITPDLVDISVEGNLLTLVGREPKREEGDKHYLIRERRSLAFERSIELPFVADSARVEARYAKGILSVEIPRAADDKPRKISIRTE